MLAMMSDEPGSVFKKPDTWNNYKISTKFLI